MAEEAPLNTTIDINKALRLNLQKSKSIKIDGLEGQESIAAGISKTAHINIKGAAGDYLGAFNNGAIVRLEGDAGRFAGTNMNAGRIIISGKTGEGLGSYLGGGTVICQGYAADCAGQGMTNGNLIIEGDAGNFIGLLMKGGTVIVLGDAGLRTGNRMHFGTIYVGGKVAGLGQGAKEESFTGDDRDNLKEIFARHGISADPGEFTKIIALDEDDSPTRRKKGAGEDGIQLAEED